jgi:hypothetical protein
MVIQMNETNYGVDDEFIALTSARSWLETPEERLLHAVLERAARDFLGTRELDIHSAKEWLFDCDDDAIKDPFSFDWICEHLSIQPDDFRRRILMARDRMPQVGRSARHPEEAREKASCAACTPRTGGGMQWAA